MYIDAKHAGRPAGNLEEKRKLGGGYNFFLQTSLPEKLLVYNPVQPSRRNSWFISYSFHNSFPSWVCCGDSPSLFRATSDCIQVQALGLHGGSFQRPCTNWGNGWTLWDWNFRGILLQFFIFYFLIRSLASSWFMIICPFPYGIYSLVWNSWMNKRRSSRLSSSLTVENC